MNDAIQGPNSSYSNPFAVLLAGGVGGARAARALATVFPGERMIVVGNVGDDDVMYGVHVSADLDTIVYTLAGIEGPHGWGIASDTFTVMGHLDRLGVATDFRLGDRDLATCLLRTGELARGAALSTVTESIRTALGVTTRVIPASDDPVRTRVGTTGGEWLAFQDYFVTRKHRDEIAELRYEGAADATPAPGVIEAIERADLVVIAPSNPPLSIAPILAVRPIHDAVAGRKRVVAISPLFRGAALKGPADRVLSSLGYAPGNEGVLAAYDGLVTDFVIDVGDRSDAEALAGDVRVHVTDTRFGTRDAAGRFGAWFAETFA